jgi:hypothetical protein
MILLITPLACAKECSAALQTGTQETTESAESFRQASRMLRSAEYSAVVIDESLAEADPEGAEVLLRHTGAGVTLFVNLGISSAERVTRDLRHALERHRRQTQQAHDEAERNLRNELRDSVTAILLSCDLVLGVPGVPPVAQSKIRSIQQQTTDLCSRLGITAEVPS